MHGACSSFNWLFDYSSNIRIYTVVNNNVVSVVLRCDNWIVKFTTKVSKHSIKIEMVKMFIMIVKFEKGRKHKQSTAKKHIKELFSFI